MIVQTYKTSCVLGIKNFNLNTMYCSHMYYLYPIRVKFWFEIDQIFVSLTRMLIGERRKLNGKKKLFFHNVFDIYFCDNYIYARNYVFLHLSCRIIKKNNIYLCITATDLFFCPENTDGDVFWQSDKWTVIFVEICIALIIDGVLVELENSQQPGSAKVFSYKLTAY